MPHAGEVGEHFYIVYEGQARKVGSRGQFLMAFLLGLAILHCALSMFGAFISDPFSLPGRGIKGY